MYGKVFPSLPSSLQHLLLILILDNSTIPCVPPACLLRASCVPPACPLRNPCVPPACPLRAPCVPPACPLRVPCVSPACPPCVTQLATRHWNCVDYVVNLFQQVSSRYLPSSHYIISKIKFYGSLNMISKTCKAIIYFLLCHSFVVGATLDATYTSMNAFTLEPLCTLQYKIECLETWGMTFQYHLL